MIISAGIKLMERSLREAIEVVDLNKSFGDLHVLKDINISVSRKARRSWSSVRPARARAPSCAA